jgi:hypothetical protein
LLVLLREIGRLVAAARFYRQQVISTSVLVTAPKRFFHQARRSTLDSHGILPQPLRGGRPTAPILRGDPIRPQG